MKLSDKVQQTIFEDYAFFSNFQYGDKSKKERKKLGQFFTPPEITITMIEMIDRESLADAKILDPTCGAGNLLVACILAGARIENCYGNEFDINILQILHNRIKKLRDDLYAKNPNDYRIISSKSGGVISDEEISINFHIGDATKKECLVDFSKEYNDTIGRKYAEAQLATMTNESVV